MRQAIAIIFMFRFLLLVSAGAAAADSRTQQESSPEFKPLSGGYMVYGSGLGDPQPASREDSKMAFAITGDAARKMFGAMGPDVRDACTAGSDIRVRTKENVSCQRENARSYRCSFGFDLRTGKSIGGSVC